MPPGVPPPIYPINSICPIVIAALVALHLVCLLYWLLRDCKLGIRIHFEFFASGRELINLDGAVGNALGRLACCCCWPAVQRLNERRRAARKARRAARSKGREGGVETLDASTMTDSRGLYLYMYRQAMQEGSLLGGRNSIATATSEPRRLDFAHSDASLAPSWETTPLARAPPTGAVDAGTDPDEPAAGAIPEGGGVDGRPRAKWGFSSDAGVMTDSIEELAGGPKGTMTEIEEADAEVQCDPVVADARHEPSDLCFAYYANYPATGSAFAGPWRCDKGSFYNGVPIQIEFDGARDEWEPCGRPPSMWRSHRRVKVPLCALIEESTRQHGLVVRTAEVARSSARADDGIATDGAAIKVVVAAELLAADGAPGGEGGASAAGDGGIEVAQSAGAYQRVAYVLSFATDGDGDALLCSRGYSSDEGGHCGEMWRLTRVGRRPPPGAVRPGGLSVFAGAWQCERGSFYGGSVIEIDVDGDVTRWFPRGGSLASYRKVDLVDLVEASLEDDQTRYMALSDDDGGQRRPGVVEHHNICSLSASQYSMTVSRAYGDEGHSSEMWTLHRVLDCGAAALDAPVAYRTYRYVYASAGSPAAHAEASKALRALRTVQFNGAREAETKQSAKGIAQAWSVDNLDAVTSSQNHEVLTSVAAILRASPELVCEIHGTTTTPRVCDPDLARHFRLDPAAQMPEVMDALARERAASCLEQLVGRGVDRRRLRVTFKGCTGESRVHFIARSTFRGETPIAYDMRDDAEATFARYDRDRSGSIDAQELRTALRELGLNADATQAASILARFDADRSDQLELGEFKQLVKEMRRFALAGAQSGGAPTRHEPREAAKAAASGLGLEPKDSVDEAFLRYNADRDRARDIDVSELKNALVALGLKADTEHAAQALRKFNEDPGFPLEIGEFRRLVVEIRRSQQSAPAAALGSPSRQVRLPPPGAAQTPSQAGAAGGPTLPGLGALPPPSGALPPPSGALPPPSGALPPPSGALPPPSGALPFGAAAAAGESVGTVFRRHAQNEAIDVGQLRTALKELQLPVSTNLEKQAKEGRNALDKQQFRALVKGLKAGGPNATPNESVGDIFRRFDVDRSGSLDAGELRAALSDLGLPVDSAAASEVLQRYDEDRSGRIEMSAFRKLVKDLKAFQAQGKV